MAEQDSGRGHKVAPGIEPRAAEPSAPSTTRGMFSSSLPRGMIQRKLARRVRAKAQPDPEKRLGAVFDGLSGGAEVPFRGELERSFGESLDGVHAHAGQGEALDGAGAEAAHRGNDVLLGRDPSKHQVAHEVAHVLQNRQSGAIQGGVAGAHDDAEEEAERAATEAASGGSARVTGGTSSAIHLMRVRVKKAPSIIPGTEYHVERQLDQGRVEILVGGVPLVLNDDQYEEVVESAVGKRKHGPAFARGAPAKPTSASEKRRRGRGSDDEEEEDDEEGEQVDQGGAEGGTPPPQPDRWRSSEEWRGASSNAPASAHAAPSEEHGFSEEERSRMAAAAKVQEHAPPEVISGSGKPNVIFGHGYVDERPENVEANCPIVVYGPEGSTLSRGAAKWVRERGKVPPGALRAISDGEYQSVSSKYERTCRSFQEELWERAQPTPYPSVFLPGEALPPLLLESQRNLRNPSEAVEEVTRDRLITTELPRKLSEIQKGRSQNEALYWTACQQKGTVIRRTDLTIILDPMLERELGDEDPLDAVYERKLQAEKAKGEEQGPPPPIEYDAPKANDQRHFNLFAPPPMAGRSTTTTTTTTTTAASELNEEQERDALATFKDQRSEETVRAWARTNGVTFRAIMVFLKEHGLQLE